VDITFSVVVIVIIVLLLLLLLLLLLCIERSTQQALYMYSVLFLCACVLLCSTVRLAVVISSTAHRLYTLAVIYCLKNKLEF